MISQATCSPCPMLKMLNGIQSMEFFIKSSTWCPSFSTSVWEYMLDSHCQRWLLTKRHLYSIVNPVVRYLASRLALEHIPPLLNQGPGRDPPSSQSSGMRGRRWIMEEKWIIILMLLSASIIFRCWRASSLQVNFEAVHNIDEWGADFVPSMREALRCWNMTVRLHSCNFCM